MDETHAEPTPHLLPRAEHLSYLANLLTVLGILFGAYLVLKQERARKRAATPLAPGWRWPGT